MHPCPPGPSSGSVQFVESVVPRLFCVRGIFLCEPVDQMRDASRTVTQRCVTACGLRPVFSPRFVGAQSKVPRPSAATMRWRPAHPPDPEPPAEERSGR
jgi:hypothetical protein